MTATTQAPTRRLGVKCHHGDDAPRGKRNACKICVAERQARYRESRKELGAEPARERMARCVCGKPVAQSAGQWERWFCSDECLDALVWDVLRGATVGYSGGADGGAVVQAKKIRGRR